MSEAPSRKRTRRTTSGNSHASASPSKRQSARTTVKTQPSVNNDEALATLMEDSAEQTLQSVAEIGAGTSETIFPWSNAETQPLPDDVGSIPEEAGILTEKPIQQSNQEPKLEADDTKMQAKPIILDPGDRSGPYSQRELFFKEQEQSGAFAFYYLQNDGQVQHSLWLIALKNIFSKQLPNMPKEYITRLVFDRRHRSVAVVKQDGSVIGGITYRPFHAQTFGEIAFCAVSANDQVKGFGSRLMAYTKQFAKDKDKLTFFLTYADNNAVTFFAKQGFTTEVTMPKDKWQGYIKDYDGGTLMESILHEEINYIGIAEMIQAQRAALDQKMRTLSNAHLTYAGLTHFQQEDYQPLTRAEIPGLVEAGWTPEAEPLPTYKISVDGRYQEPSREVIGRFGKYAVTALQAHDDALAFLQPVRADEVPDYYDVIKDPIDLSKIDRRLSQGRFYVTLELFLADIRKIFKNARIYNAADTYWYKAANRLEAYFEQYLSSSLMQSSVAYA